MSSELFPLQLGEGGARVRTTWPRFSGWRCISISHLRIIFRTWGPTHRAQRTVWVVGHCSSTPVNSSVLTARSCPTCRRGNLRSWRWNCFSYQTKVTKKHGTEQGAALCQNGSHAAASRMWTKDKGIQQVPNIKRYAANLTYIWHTAVWQIAVVIILLIFDITSYTIYSFLIIIYHWGKILNFPSRCFTHLNDGVCVDFGTCGVPARVLATHGDSPRQRQLYFRRIKAPVHLLKQDFDILKQSAM